MIYLLTYFAAGVFFALITLVIEEDEVHPWWLPPLVGILWPIVTLKTIYYLITDDDDETTT